MCFVNCVVALLFLISCIVAKDSSGMPYVITFFVLAIVGEITDAVSRLLISKSKNLDRMTEKTEYIYLKDDSKEKDKL
nr:MAG TPA: hypothetical protein [Caudoviricetes sp.]